MSTRKINVVAAHPVNTGTSDSGREWTLYEITATTLEGEPIELKLKSFERLDGEVEVEVEKQTHEKFGDSYMLKPLGSKGGNPGARLGPKVDELRGRIEALEAAVEALRADVNGLQTGVTQQPARYGQPPRNALFDDPEGEPEDVPF